MKFSSRRAGFTLIELMVVVAIIAIMTILALPSFAEWAQNSKTRTTAESIENGLRFAQAEAASRSRLTQFALVGNGWTVTYTQTASDTATGSTAPSNPLQTSPETNYGNVSVAASPSSSAVIQFNSLGRASGAASTTGTFSALTSNASYQTTNSGGTRAYNVLVSPAGKIRMCDANAGTYSETNPNGC